MRNAEGQSTFSIAGWLFADLLLVLSITFLIADHWSRASAELLVESHSLSNGVSTEILIPSETPIVPIAIGLGEAQCYNIELRSKSYNVSEVLDSMQRIFPNSQDVRAGLVLVWTHGTSIKEGVFISKGISQLIRRNFPLSFGEAKFKSLGFSSGNLFLVQIEIYFFTDAPWAIGKDVPCLYTN